MKIKYSLSFLLLLVTVIVNGQVRDRVRISYIGFNCNNETWDNALEMDGKGDEVYIVSNWIMMNKDGTQAFDGKFRSLIHGDVNNHNGWIQAGSRSAQGGIRSGDQYRGSTVIGEFDIEDGQVLNITPTIWEYDGDQGALNLFTNFFTGFASQITDKSVQFFNGAIQNIARVTNTSQLLMAFKNQNIPLFPMGVSDILGQAKDRPIGINTSGQFSPNSLILNRDIIRKFSQINTGYGLGVYQVDYDENQLGNTRDHGAYSILIKVEVTGSTGAPATPVVTPPTKSVAPVLGLKNNTDKFTQPVATKAVSGNAFTGKWVGAYGSGSTTPNNYYAFQLNADGTLQIFTSANTAAAGNGKYNITGNTLTATYTYNSGGTFSVQGIITAAGSQINGTWGSGNNSTSGGNWMMTKR